MYCNARLLPDHAISVPWNVRRIINWCACEAYFPCHFCCYCCVCNAFLHEIMNGTSLNNVFWIVPSINGKNPLTHDVLNWDRGFVNLRIHSEMRWMVSHKDCLMIFNKNELILAFSDKLRTIEHFFLSAFQF